MSSGDFLFLEFDKDKLGDLVIDASKGILVNGREYRGKFFDCNFYAKLNEETGIVYNKNDFNELLLINYFQKDYPTREEEVVNRLIKTYYYTGKFNGINENNMHISKNEIEGNLKLELLTTSEIKERLKTYVDNPRNDYFVKEIEFVIDEYLKENNYGESLVYSSK